MFIPYTGTVCVYCVREHCIRSRDDTCKSCSKPTLAYSFISELEANMLGSVAHNPLDKLPSFSVPQSSTTALVRLRILSGVRVLVFSTIPYM